MGTTEKWWVIPDNEDQLCQYDSKEELLKALTEEFVLGEDDLLNYTFIVGKKIVVKKSKFEVDET